MPPLPKPPEGEQGAATLSAYVPGPLTSGGAPSWVYFQPEEDTPEWRWPTYTHTVDRMLTESQVWSLFMGLVAPLLGYDWAIDPGDADADLTAALAADLGLPVGLPTAEEYAIEPGTWRFNFVEHLWETLLTLAYGHYFYEQEAVWDDSDSLFHLKALHPRPPSTIAEILVGRSGGLRAIRQNILPMQTGAQLFAGLPLIDAQRLVAYVWLPDGKRRWTGRSMMRPCYAPYLLKDRLQRVDAINHERAGGIPGVETDATWQGANLQELRDLASQARVGEESGFALPPGAHLVLARAGGTDVVGSMKYHDDNMARAWAGMVRQLGSTVTGSRALGETDAALEAVLRLAVATWFATNFREHVVEDWWQWNAGLQPSGRPWPHPRLVFRAGAAETAAAGVGGTTGPPIQNTPPGSVGGDPPANPPVAAGSRPRRDRAGAAPRHAEPRAVAGALPARPLRRELFDHEVRAAVDFAALDVAYTQAVSSVEGLFLTSWLPESVDAVRAAIAFTKAGEARKRVTRTDMAKVRAPVMDHAMLADLLLVAARAGAANAAAELLTQGTPVLAPTDEVLAALVADQARAVAQQTADGLSLAASRRAVQLVGERSPREVADEVVSYLHGLEHRWERDQLAGAVQAASNSGRFEVFGRIPSEAAVDWYSSELLDAATCAPCAEEDGKSYPDLVAATRAYPTGGFVHCKGGPRCRGTVVATLAESAAPAPADDPLGLFA